MAEVLGDVLGFAIGIAVSPVPIAAVILMLFASKARVTGPSFLIGWLIGITFVVTVVLFVPGLGGDSGEPSTTTGVIKGILGLLLLVDTMGSGGAFGLAILLTVLNPKNLLLAAAAGAAIGAAELNTGETVLAVVAFTVIASVTIVIPVIGYLIAGDRIQSSLDNTKEWMVHNNTAVMSVLFLIFGVILVGDAVGIIWG